jgi:hypothetical protein
VQDRNMKHVRKIMKRVVGRILQVCIYKTLEVIKIGYVLLVGGQLDDLHFELSEAMETWM